MDERSAYIALNMMEGIGPVKVRAMIEVLGSAAAIFDAPEADLLEASGVGKKLAQSIQAQRGKIDPAKEERRAADLDADIISFADEGYPKILRQIHDPPMALYVRGSLEDRDKHAIAVVGSRNCTHYGMQCSDLLSYGLAQVGYTVVSGLARGIDTAAHHGALKAKGRTIAVLGSALDELYPTENQDLAEKIVKQGALISEFPLGTKPGRTTFPMRNRIVTGLSLGVLVVEAGLKSGAMISVDEAAAQGRLIFAVPGRIDSNASKGCHSLLRTKAILVEDVRDVTEEFEYLISPKLQAAERPKPKMNEQETIIVGLLEGGAMDVDTLIREAKIEPAKINSLLLGMEMKRLVKILPGRLVEKA